MKRLLLLILLFTWMIYAETMHAAYKVEYGIFGKMGVSDAWLTKRGDRYEIKMVAKATGLAKVLSGGRVEIYESSGRIEDGKLVPDLFRKNVKRSSKRRIKTYLFDHLRKKVTYHQISYRHGKKADESDGELPYYAKNDILSLYFNISSIIGDCSEPFDKTLKAVGAEKKTGRIRIQTIVGKKRKRLAKELPGGSCYLKVTIYQKIFGSKGGELYLALRPDNVVQRALLKDVVMFGDIRGKLIRFEVK
ncbi:DUF3108 domain-containing protein [Hydrogenimonas sp.]